MIKQKYNHYLVELLNSFNLAINIHINLIMVLIRTESIPYNTNGSFGEIINKFQDRNIKKHLGSWKKKEKNF